LQARAELNQELQELEAYAAHLCAELVNVTVSIPAIAAPPTTSKVTAALTDSSH